MNTESMGTGMPGTKVPIYELAKELGIANKDLVTKIRALGIEAKNHMSRLEPEDVLRIRRSIDKEKQENTVQERLSDTVIRRRAKDGTMLRPPTPPPAPPAPTPPPAPPVAARPAVVATPPVTAPRVTPPVAKPEAAAEARPTVRVRAAAENAAKPAEVATPAAPRVEAPAAAPAKAAPVAAEATAAAKPARPTAPADKPAVVEAKPAAAPAKPTVAAAPAKEAARDTERTAEKAGDKAPEKVAEKAPDKAAEKAPDKAAEKTPDKAAEKTAEKVVEKAPDKVGEKASEKAAERTDEKVTAKPAHAAAPAAVAEKAPPVTTKAAAEPETRPAPKSAVTVRGPAAETARPATPAAAPAGETLAAKPTPAEPEAARPAAATPPAAPATPMTAAQAAAAAQQQRVFVTAQTRRVSEGLGPTGRVIDLAALRPAAPAAPARPSADSPRGFRSPEPEAGVARGPRQEVTGERLRQPPAKQQMLRHQPGKSKPQPGRKAKQTQITTAAEHKRVVKMDETVVIANLAQQMGLKATDVLKKIWELGLRSLMINSSIDFDTAQLVATEFEWRVESTAFQEESVVADTVDQPEDLLPRAPVITIMGHVDHGKTSLLDAIRNANVAAGEAGGITQHIGAYKISSSTGDVVFLDTPGHEAFTEMRARGAQVTDIVVLVVAADDGVMPQTLEALNHAKDAKVPIIVAVNKIDKPGAQPERIRQQLSAHGLQPEEWGGSTIYVDVSARTRVGIERLLEMLALQSEVLELKANPNKAGRGAVIEARMDAKRGPVASVLVQEGTLRVGDTLVVGEEMGKVRAMMDDKGRQLTSAGPSTPVEVLGLSGVPRAGEVLNVVTDDRSSKDLVEFRRNKRVEKDRAKAGPVSLDKLMDAMKAGLKELKVILKADVQGSVEALSSALLKLTTPQVKVTVIQAGVGGITETDVNLAKAGNAIIIGFHVRPAGKASGLAEQEGVDIKLYDIIYDALDEVKRAMAGLLAPIKRDKMLGKAEVRELYTIPKIGLVLGCAITEGLVRRSAHCRLIRDSVLIYTGRLGSLRRFKDDVREVQQGYECGLTIEGYSDVKAGDVIESFEIEEFAPTLA